MKVVRWPQIGFSLLMLVLFFSVLEVRQRIRHPHVGFRGMTNSLGFRSPELSPKKEPGTQRILFIGSSTVFGVTGPVERTFPYLVGQILKEKKPGQRIEIVNAAWPGKTSYWEVTRLRETLSLDPDWIVVMTGYNDSVTAYLHLSKIDKRGDLELTPWYFKIDSFLSRHSVLYVTFREKLSILLEGDPRLAFIRRDVAWEGDPGRPEWFQHYPQHFRRNLEEMIRLAGVRRVPLVFIRPPLSERRKLERPLYARAFERLMEELESVAGENRIPVIDLKDLSKAPGADDYFGSDAIHFTDAGNRALAQAVSEFLLAGHPALSP